MMVLIWAILLLLSFCPENVVMAAACMQRAAAGDECEILPDLGIPGW